MGRILNSGVVIAIKGLYLSLSAFRQHDNATVINIDDKIVLHQVGPSRTKKDMTQPPDLLPIIRGMISLICLYIFYSVI